MEDRTNGISMEVLKEAVLRAGRMPQNAEEDCVRLALIDTPLGSLVAGAVREGLCLLEYADPRALESRLQALGKRFGLPLFVAESPVFSRLRKELTEYFSGSRTAFDVPLVLKGSEFQERTWRELWEIPCGATISYADLARRIGSPKACRAVGRANGLNPIAILVPCHRVVNADGRMGGYSGGLWRKQALLEREQAVRAST